MTTAPPPAGTAEPDSLVQRLIEEMNRRWRAGERPPAEDYLARFPHLGDDAGAALELIYEEICLRRERGEEPAAAELLGRFPQWRAELEVLLDCHRVLEPAVAPPRFPAAGEAVGDFRLLAELGRGAAGRVFLARQADLADRPVVVKLVPRAGAEHLTLARLQHTYIVPLYAIQDDPGRRLRALCMPYFGGMTLAGLLDALRGRPPAQRSGQEILAALREARRDAPVAIPVPAPAGPELTGPSYTRAVCWVGACLAEALAYAHERGLVHLDLKPSNVLLAADGQPMLLDFHLARAPLRPADPPPDWLGGTPAYMAPEQQAALDAVRAGRPVPQVVDGRADVYGLGLLLYEALGGPLPLPPAPGRALRRANRAVSVGLADLVARCLAADPDGRYPSAGALAADLCRHLDDLPLRGVANRSLAESWRKWRRRRPLALALVSLVLLGAGAAVYSRAHFGRLAAEAEGSQREGLGQMRLGEYGRAREAFRRGLDLARDVPFQEHLARELGDQLHLADRAAAGQELHGIVERLRPLYGADELPAAEARALQRQCRSFWEQRGRIADRLLPQPAPALDEQVRTDMLDLAVLWTDLRVRAARADSKSAARRQALEVLDEAEALFGRSCVLERERRDHAAALGLPRPPAAVPEPGTPWEHYALGRALLRAGDLAGAEQHLQMALSPQPQAPWPHFYHGKCAYQLGRYDDAAEDFTVCAVLDPGCAWCFYNRALAYTGLGRAERDRPDLADRDRDRAERDCDQALKLDPTLAAAALARGMLRYERQHYDEAVADLRQALEGGAAPAVAHYDLALVELARGDRAAAREQLRQALRDDPAHKEARALLDSLQGLR